MAIDGSALRADLNGPASWVAALRLGRSRFLVADRALDGCPDPSFSPLFREDPGALLPWGAMPHVLAVTAGEHGHPVPRLVQVEGDDGSLHG
jgi:hypothetical protein